MLPARGEAEGLVRPRTVRAEGVAGGLGRSGRPGRYGGM